MIEVDLSQPCGRHLTFRDLIEAGETWHAQRPPSVKLQEESVESLIRLAEQILDRVIDEFGPIRITYGFAPPSLTKHIKARIDPERDQHAGHELRRNGQCICGRLGQAVDFTVEGVGAGRLSLFVARHLEFDRVYFYGDDRPLHVSVAPADRPPSKAMVAMLPGPKGNRVPRMVGLKWLSDQFGN